MQLKQLADQLAVSKIIGDENTNITGLSMDSRHVQPGDLFICVPGLTHDGHDFAHVAIELGAGALVTERDIGANVPQLIVKDSRFAMALLSAHYYGYPSTKLRLIGITGTNGKTTTSYLIEAILRDSGLRTGLMGTIRMKVGDEEFEMKGTTLESLDLQRNLNRMVAGGVDCCVMEVSSHALDMGRVKGCSFRTALFTNMTQDHLDYHHSMEQYAAAKGLFFSRLGNDYGEAPESRRFAVLNADDAASQTYDKLTAAQVITYGIDNPADVRATQIRVTSSGTDFHLTTFRGEATIRLRLVGKFNVYNALGAIAATLLEGVSLGQIANSLERIPFVEGRMEPVQAGQPFLVLVDYAHSPDGLENALGTIKQFARGKVICVFGCGGDRDRTKRPIMGRIAVRYSDYTIVTSDNPRSERPESIIHDIEEGITAEGCGSDRYELVADRRVAIQKAIELARPEDVVLIAGKGHEPGQLVNGIVHDFDDRLVAQEAIRSLFT